MRVLVVKIHEHLPVSTFEVNGNTVTCNEWNADLNFNGKLHEHCRLRAFSQKVLWAGKEGAIVECSEPKDHKGTTEVKIITPSNSNGDVNKEPVFDGQASNKGQPELPMRQQPVGNYTVEEFADLFRAAVENAISILPMMETDARKATVQDACALTATFLIGAQKAGIRVERKTRMNEKMKIELMNTINKVLLDTGMAESTVTAGLTEDDLIKFWIDCDANPTKFCLFVQRHIG